MSGCPLPRCSLWRRGHQRGDPLLRPDLHPDQRRAAAGAVRGDAGAAVLPAAGKPYYHLYFLFVLAGLYAISPFLRIVVAHAKLVRGAAVAVGVGVVATHGPHVGPDEHRAVGEQDEYFVMPLSPTVMMTALGAFVLFRALGQRRAASAGSKSRLIHRLSALSFGVYLCTPLC